MFRDVLIATDGSNLSLEVLKPVSRLLAPLKGGRLIVLHVLPRESETAYSTRERCLNTANAALEKAKLRLVDLRWSVETLVEEGDPAEQILQVAEREAVDLIALASHGHTGLTRLVRGSVAERVLRSASAPVLICTPTSSQPEGVSRGPFQRILVPLDGSECAGQIVPLAGAMAFLCEAQLVLFHVRTGAVLQTPLAEVEAKLRREREALAEAGVEDVLITTAEGNTAEEILAVVERLGIDLVALATHGRTGVMRWSLGSVAEAVARACRAPLLVFRPNPLGAPPREAPPREAPPPA
ncbi:MAG TPA: hypothetical protein DEA08_13070 [Planctomycetes bacterium]|nr:hypothetical protein [Planctomycetota bacterium]